MAERAETTPCPGAGRKWQPGMGSAICPVCHSGSKSMGLPGGKTVNGRMAVAGHPTVPDHMMRKSRS